jgi:trimethylamine---corrinoid protein Co-methyltransferase
MEKKTIQVLHEATGTLLARTGVCLDSEPALRLLAEHGVRVDFPARRVYPTLEHVAQALVTAPAGFTLYHRRADRPLEIGGDQVYVIAGGASVRVLTLEGQYEEATWEHLRQFTTLLDALPQVHILLNQVDPTDSGGKGYYRRIAAELFLGSSKPFCLQAEGAEDVEAFVDMAAVLRGSRQAVAEKPLFLTGTNAEPPLVIPEAAADILLAASAAGVPCGIGDYPMMGLTGPATPAGVLVQRNAVQLTALLLSQFSHPGAPFYYVGAAGAVNPRTLEPRLASPPAVKILRTSAALGRSYGLPVYGLAITDARWPDGQAACERTATFLAALEGGAQLIQGPTSMMDQMMLSSLAQAVIDHDIVGYLLAAWNPLDTSPEALALEAIQEVATDPSLRAFRFGAHSHTVAHLRDEEWYPRAFGTDSFTAWRQAGSPTLIDRATALARDLLVHHQPEPLEEAEATEILRIAKEER